MTEIQAEPLSLKAKLFRGLADPSRLAILEALRGGARSVSEVVAATGLSQPNTSNHLACLLECALVEREQRGRYVYYGLADERVNALLSLGDEVLSGVARGAFPCARHEASSVEEVERI